MSERIIVKVTVPRCKHEATCPIKEYVAYCGPQCWYYEPEKKKGAKK